MRFAFSKTVAKSRGWVVLKPWLVVKPGKIDVLVGLLSDSPPSGRRTYFYTQPLARPNFSLSTLSFSEERLSEGDGLTSDNASSTAALIDKFEEEVNSIGCDESYQSYMKYLDRNADDEAIAGLDYYCLTKAYLCVMVGNHNRAYGLLKTYAKSPSGHERERMDASADRLREALNRSLAEARDLVRAVAKHNCQAVGLPAWNQA